MITRASVRAKSGRTQNFEGRKHLLEYDDVMNKQRQAVLWPAAQPARRAGSEGPDSGELLSASWVT